MRLFGHTRDWVSHRRQKNQLEKQLAQNLAAARSHEENSLPLGHKYYQGIYQRAMEDVEAFSTRWEIPLDRMFEDYPALVVLQAMAGGGSEETGTASGGFPVGRLVLAVLLLAVLSPALFGLWNGIYHVVVKKIGG